MTTDSQIRTLIKQEVKSLATYLEEEDYNNALNDAKRETGWSTFSTDFKVHWGKMRAKRHLFFYLATETARKFKVKQFSLDQRFKHYMTLIKDMDLDFVQAKEDYPEEFVSVDAEHLFGTKIDAGFAYDGFGADITYDEDQTVIINPSD